MDELKLLIEMVANLPTLAVWVLVGYLVYKIAVVGSIYALIRFGIEKSHDWLVRKNMPQTEITLMLDGLRFDGASSKAALITQLERLRFIGNPSEGSSYGIYEQYGVRALRKAIDKIYEDADKKQ